MVDQMTLQTIGILLTAVTVSIAAIYYTMTLRYAKRSQELQLETRQAQLFMPIYSTSYNEEHIKAISEIQKWEYDSARDKKRHRTDNNRARARRVLKKGD